MATLSAERIAKLVVEDIERDASAALARAQKQHEDAAILRQIHEELQTRLRPSRFLDPVRRRLVSLTKRAETNAREAEELHALAVKIKRAGSAKVYEYLLGSSKL